MFAAIKQTVLIQKRCLRLLNKPFHTKTVLTKDLLGELICVSLFKTVCASCCLRGSISQEPEVPSDKHNPFALDDPDEPNVDEVSFELFRLSRERNISSTT